MGMTHTLTRTWRSGDRALETTETITSSGEINISESIPAESTDLQLTLAIDFSALKSLYIACDRDITIETNSGSAADDTIALKADKPIIWSPNCGLDCPLTADVTSIFVTLAAGAAATLEIRGLQDVTP